MHGPRLDVRRGLGGDHEVTHYLELLHGRVSVGTVPGIGSVGARAAARVVGAGRGEGFAVADGGVARAG